MVFAFNAVTICAARAIVVLNVVRLSFETEKGTVRWNDIIAIVVAQQLGRQFCSYDVRYLRGACSALMEDAVSQKCAPERFGEAIFAIGAHG